MIGSNSTALRQHAYSVFTASRRESGQAGRVPESVRRPAFPVGWQASSPHVDPARPQPAQLAESKPSVGVSQRGTVAGHGVQAVPQRRTEPDGSATDPNPQQGEAPTHDEIRARAYEVFQARCRHDRPGDPVQDWLQAEAELRRECGVG